jgi:hypothetical protein
VENIARLTAQFDEVSERTHGFDIRDLRQQQHQKDVYLLSMAVNKALSRHGDAVREELGNSALITNPAHAAGGHVSASTSTSGLPKRGGAVVA